MRTFARYTCAAVLFLTASTLCAQGRDADRRFNQAVYYQPNWPVDWKPDPGTELYDGTTARPRQIRRYTLAVHPGHTLRHGLRLDFEIELKKPGKWLQMGAMGYYAPEHTDEGFPYYRKRLIGMNGGGFSVAYKSMLDHTGYYCSAGVLCNYYNVDHDRYQYRLSEEDGLPFYGPELARVNTRFHQPALFVNLGRQAVLGKHAFLDLFCGLGYMHSLHSGPRAFTRMYGYGYRGPYFNGGLRLGIVWQRKANPVGPGL